MSESNLTIDERIENAEANIGNLMGHICLLRLINFKFMDHLKADFEAEFSLIISHLEKAANHYEQKAIQSPTPYNKNLYLSFLDTLDNLRGTRLPSVD